MLLLVVRSLLGAIDSPYFLEPRKIFAPLTNRSIKLAHSLGHKNVLNEQLKQWVQRMQCEIFLGNSVLVDLIETWPTVEHYTR
jgi:hypothetical protein